jgi:chemotaxis protein MotB
MGNDIVEKSMKEIDPTASSQGRNQSFYKPILQIINALKSKEFFKKIRAREDERGLVITLAGDIFFKPASAELNIEESRQVLVEMAALLAVPELKDAKFRVEGHTDNVPSDPASAFPTNWELSTARAVTVLHYLVDFGVNEQQFQAAGFSDTVPLSSNETEEGRANNRRVDIVILQEGHL